MDKEERQPMEEKHSKEKSTLAVGGYLFLTEKDAQLARAEEQRISYLEERIDYSSPESIRYIYEKTIQERMFKTPIGLCYLKKLRDFLLSQPEIAPESVMDIPLYIAFDGELREHTNPARARVAPSRKEKDKEKNRFVLSVILNVMLVVTIIAMFGISFASDQPNIVNYERVITNKYAAWEQELTEREQAVREKEREWKLSQ